MYMSLVPEVFPDQFSLYVDALHQVGIRCVAFFPQAQISDLGGREYSLELPRCNVCMLLEMICGRFEPRVVQISH